MIKIEEGKQVGILYHYTSVDLLLHILDEDTLLSRLNGDDSRTISFTRDKNFEKVKGRSIHSTEARMVFDGNKISDRYKLEPYNFFKYSQTGKNYEAEEQLVIDKLKGIRNYLIRVELLESALPIWCRHEPYISAEGLSEIAEEIKDKFGVECIVK
jgi:hypothetical protein